MFSHRESDNKIESWRVQPPKQQTKLSKISYFTLGPVLGYLFDTEFSGPYLMIFTFVSSFLFGILCVKSCCKTPYGLRSFAHEVKVARRKMLASYDSSDEGLGGSDSSMTIEYSDNRSESGTSTYSVYSASDGVFFDENN